MVDGADVLTFIIGAGMVGLILIDIFFTIVVPRRAPTLGQQLRLSTVLVPMAWRIWRFLGLRLPSSDRREAFLGLFGALAVVLLLDGWVVLLIIGYGLMLFALRGEL